MVHMQLLAARMMSPEHVLVLKAIQFLDTPAVALDF